MDTADARQRTPFSSVSALARLPSDCLENKVVRACEKTSAAMLAEFATGVMRKT